MAKSAKRLNTANTEDDFFKTIGDVSAELKVPTHVLRFWEGKFPEIKPMKRKGGHRYYRPQDVDTIIKIRDLLYDQGYTIKGAQKYLRNVKRGKVVEPELKGYSATNLNINDEKHNVLGQGSLFGDEVSEKPKIEPEKVRSFIKELEQVKDMLNSN